MWKAMSSDGLAKQRSYPRSTAMLIVSWTYQIASSSLAWCVPWYIDCKSDQAFSRDIKLCIYICVVAYVFWFWCWAWQQLVSSDCIVVQVNTHHHMFQCLTRGVAQVSKCTYFHPWTADLHAMCYISYHHWSSVQESKLFGWLTTCYEAWQHMKVIGNFSLFDLPPWKISCMQLQACTNPISSQTDLSTTIRCGVLLSKYTDGNERLLSVAERRRLHSMQGSYGRAHHDWVYNLKRPSVHLSEWCQDWWFHQSCKVRRLEPLIVELWYAALKCDSFSTTFRSAWQHSMDCAECPDTLHQVCREIGMRFHPTRGAMSLGKSKGGLPPDNCVEEEPAALEAMKVAIEEFHDKQKWVDNTIQLCDRGFCLPHHSFINSVTLSPKQQEVWSAPLLRQWCGALMCIDSMMV